MNPIDTLFEVATPIQRKLLENVRYVPETECWEWTGTMQKGRPTIYVGTGRRGRKQLDFRRVSFTEFIGPIAEGDRVFSKCKNTRCGNPSHIGVKPTVFWTKDRCIKECEKYENISQLKKFNTSLYTLIYRYGYVNDCFPEHRERLALTKEECVEEALKYNCRSDFEKFANREYTHARKNGWYSECVAHMNQTWSETRNLYTLDFCRNAATSYTDKESFRTHSLGAYNAAHRNGWLSEITAHMTSKKLPNGYWTKERCAHEASRFDKKSEFRKQSPSAYNIAKRNKWVDEICSHMQRRLTPIAA